MSPRLHTQTTDHAELSAVAAAIVALVLHYLDGGAMLDPALLGAAWTAVALPVLMFAVRLGARLLAALPAGDAPPGGESGHANVEAILLMVVAAMVALLVGCGSNYHLRQGTMRVAKTAEGQTCAVISGDGDPDVVTVCWAKVAIKLPREVCRGAQ